MPFFLVCVADVLIAVWGVAEKVLYILVDLVTIGRLNACYKRLFNMNAYGRVDCDLHRRMPIA